MVPLSHAVALEPQTCTRFECPRCGDPGVVSKKGAGALDFWTAQIGNHRVCRSFVRGDLVFGIVGHTFALGHGHQSPERIRDEGLGCRASSHVLPHLVEGAQRHILSGSRHGREPSQPPHFAGPRSASKHPFSHGPPRIERGRHVGRSGCPPSESPSGVFGPCRRPACFDARTEVARHPQQGVLEHAGSASPHLRILHGQP